jgi:hypothetical protein
LTALLPPPPTPRTLMIEDFCFGRSKWIIRKGLDGRTVFLGGTGLMY